MAATKAEAEQAFDLFIETFEAKYPKATVCPTEDRDVLLTFYGFPADHWVHTRTTNPIESTSPRFGCGRGEGRAVARGSPA